ncbi:MAG TPA: ribonuclease PH [Syntrophaceae bacterium]|jgi:ribonuclease PH|nr:ribonuclease PH [Syntrophaceae bacterium]
MRVHGRKWNEIREIKITRDFLKYPEGAVLIEVGDTKVICTATIEDNVPAFLKNTGKGWLTAEYSMLPMSTQSRTARESTRGRVGGRTHEIQRLIGRSLRAVTALDSFGEKTIYIDCDVIQADGGTRTASITGGFVALVDLFRSLKRRGVVNELSVEDYVAAVSVGVVDGQIYLDLEYEEDARAEVDMNFIMTGNGRFIEIQGTAEEAPFSRDMLNKMTDTAIQGIADITKKQVEVLGKLL